MSKAHDVVKNELIPLAIEKVRGDEAVVRESVPGEKSEVRYCDFSHRGENYRVMQQNTEKESRFASLAKKGHEVLWIAPSNGSGWFLVVDGQWTNKQRVSQDGELLEGHAF